MPPCGRIVMRPYERFCGAAVGAIHESPVSPPGRLFGARLFKPPPKGAPFAGHRFSLVKTAKILNKYKYFLSCAACYAKINNHIIAYCAYRTARNILR